MPGPDGVPRSESRGGLRVEVTRSSVAWRALPGAGARCIGAARAALSGATALRGAPFAEGAMEISIVLADDMLVHRLNHEWRGKDAPTNVLSFPAQDFRAAPSPVRAPAGGLVPLGDVVLAFETIRREAAAQGKTFANHLTHLVVHGALHLLGFDHVGDAEAARMEGLERGVLARLGIADPYAAGQVAEAVHG